MTLHRWLPGALTAALACLAAGLGGRALAAEEAGARPGGLPSVRCVEVVRDARLARERGDAAGARLALESALTMPDCELPALSGLLRLVREGAEDAVRAAELRDRLASRLADPQSDLPEGLLSQLARLGAAGDSAGDELYLAALQRRLASATVTRVTGTTGATGSGLALAELLEILAVSADLEQRLGRDEAARSTLDRLLALAPTPGLQWRALLFDLEHERWQSAADLLAQMVAGPEVSGALRSFYVVALANLGRYDEMSAQLAQLAPPLPAATPAGGTPLVLPSSYAIDTAGVANLLLSSAWALRDAGRENEAANLFRRALAYDPESREAQMVLLHLYGTAEERLAAAGAAAARREREVDPLALFEEGTDLLGASDAAAARELLARAAPGLAGSNYAEPAWYNLGSATFKLERWQEAAAAFAEAIAVNGERAESYYKQGLALYHLERCREAVAALLRALELQPDKRDAHYYLAGCYTRLGDSTAAARESAIFNRPR